MAEKKITRKVISRPSVEKAEDIQQETAEPQKGDRTKRGCFFCKSKTKPSYLDVSTLRRFVTDRAKIVPRAKSSVCSKHQRLLTRQIKYARHLSLLPFTPKV